MYMPGKELTKNEKINMWFTYIIIYTSMYSQLNPMFFDHWLHVGILMDHAV